MNVLRPISIKSLIACILALAFFFPAGVLAQGKVATADEIVAIYGAPDSIESSENERPRPLITTRWFIYKAAGVKLMFLADSIGGSPPNKRWVLTEALNLSDGKPLPAAEVKRRLQQR
jgi:hypothetical protein